MTLIVTEAHESRPREYVVDSAKVVYKQRTESEDSDGRQLLPSTTGSLEY